MSGPYVYVCGLSGDRSRGSGWFDAYLPLRAWGAQRKRLEALCELYVVRLLGSLT